MTPTQCLLDAEYFAFSFVYCMHQIIWSQFVVSVVYIVYIEPSPKY